MYHNVKGNFSKNDKDDNIKILFPKTFSEEEIEILREMAHERAAMLESEENDTSDLTSELD